MRRTHRLGHRVEQIRASAGRRRTADPPLRRRRRRAPRCSAGPASPSSSMSPSTAIRRSPAADAAPPAPRASRRDCRCSFRPAAGPCRRARAIRRRAPRPATGTKASSARATRSYDPGRAPDRCTAAASAASAFIAMWRPGAFRRNRTRVAVHVRDDLAAVRIRCEFDQAHVRPPAPRRSSRWSRRRRPCAAAETAASSRGSTATPPGSRPRRIAAFSSAIASMRAEKADMRLLHRGDDRDMRAREARERRDLAGMVHADLGDAERAVRRHPRQGQRHAPVVVVGSDRGMRAAERAPGSSAASPWSWSCRRCR